MYRPSFQIVMSLLIAATALALTGCRAGESTPSSRPASAPSASTPESADPEPPTTAPAADVMPSQMGRAPKPSPEVAAEKDARRISALGHDLTPPTADFIAKRDKELDSLSYKVMRKAGTEYSGTSDLLDEKRAGVFVCKYCGLPLFASGTKFESGTGWPSFFRPIDPEHIREDTDHKLGYPRTEVLCARCGSHLGHVFRDGPEPTGLRYCINGAALEFLPADAEIPERSRPVSNETR